ncbi:rho GTPase-activating protein 7-like isoform X4 [Arachis ipaensis]|uniref:rho GTPase-activating protein 7-like isoform X4 n=1 Tax=Arachis ipaensis TaxID=130454 RepID=UPI000A2B8359|nr:rho GTPase-activating protein 7-like isoform X4 [Arachis ipaensis]XP_025676478.1 rho GTPase-activating protein 7 isoform X4 [Arachis hypogaea]
MRSRLLSGSILYSIHGLGIRLGSANPKECFRRDKRPVKSLVVGRPILLALEDIDEGTKVEEILRQSTDVEEVDRRVQEYEQASRRYEAAGWIRKMVKVVAGCGESY